MKGHIVAGKPGSQSTTKPRLHHAYHVTPARYEGKKCWHIQGPEERWTRERDEGQEEACMPVPLWLQQEPKSGKGESSA